MLIACKWMPLYKKLDYNAKVSHPTLQPPLFEYAPSCMLHINQSWCTPWHDFIDPTILRLKAKGINFLW
jgi:hypothetical protein